MKDISKALGGSFWTPTLPAVLLLFQAHNALRGGLAQCILPLGLTGQAGTLLGGPPTRKLSPAAFHSAHWKYKRK